MLYIPTTKVTQKGQATIPLAVRQRLDLKPGDSIRFEMDEKTGETKIFKVSGFLEFAKEVREKYKDKFADKDPLQARELMESNYERI